MEKSKQVGCGYCVHENRCMKRDPKVNKAKEGCEDYTHWEDEPKIITVKKSASHGFSESVTPYLEHIDGVSDKIIRVKKGQSLGMSK